MGHPPVEFYDSMIRSTIPRYDELMDDVVDIVTHIDTVSTWLDVGCGTGNLVEKSSKLFKNTEFTLLDISEDMLSFASKKLGNKHSYVLSSSDSMPFEDSSFDVVTCIQSTHYYKEEDHLKALKECYRVLKDKGILLITENVASMSEKGYEITRARMKDFLISKGRRDEESEMFLDRYGTEYFPKTVEEHISELKKAGFSSVEVFRYSHMQIGLFAFR